MEMVKLADRQWLVQAFKYGVVGILNTLVCLGLIFVCKSLLGINEYVSNAIGYTAGFANSFIWNRSWVFEAHGHGLSRHAILFLLGFLLCYSIQLFVVWVINHGAFGDTLYDLGFFVISGYGIATLIGNVAYTIANFLYNKFITFSK